MDTDKQYPIQKLNTDALLNGIFQACELDAFWGEHEAAFSFPALHDYLNVLCREKGMLRADIIKRAGIDRSFGFQIFQGVKKPSRDKVLQLAIGMRLTYEETQTLLRIARHPQLYPRIKRDAALIYCINRRMGFTDVQAMLSDLGVSILGRENELL